MWDQYPVKAGLPKATTVFSFYGINNIGTVKLVLLVRPVDFMQFLNIRLFVYENIVAFLIRSISTMLSNVIFT